MAVTDLGALPVNNRIRIDNQQVEMIYLEHADALMRLAVGLVGPDNAHDLVSTAIAKCLASRGDWRELDDPASYLYRTVFREGSSFFRKVEVRSRAFKALGGTSTWKGEDGVNHIADQELFRAALNGLSARQRAVCVLTYWEDMSAVDIAELLQISHGSVKKHLARAHANLRKELNV